MTTGAVSSLEQDLGIDPDVLLARYRAERDRRLRPDGVAQFVPSAGYGSKFTVHSDDSNFESGLFEHPDGGIVVY